MKKLLLSLVTIFLLFNISFTKAEELRPGEFVIQFVNSPSSWNITVKIQAFGTVWNQFHNVTTYYSGGQKNYNSNMIPIPEEHISDFDWSNQGYAPVLSLGLYEVSIWEGSNKRAWFFIDYRTSDLPYATAFGIDVVIKYDVTNQSFEFIQPNPGTLNNGDYYPIWEICGTIELQTDALQNYWGNALTIIPQYDIYEEYYEPLLIWGPYNGFQPQGYKVYWRYNSSGSYYLLQTVSSGTYQYLHQSVPIGKGGSYLEYKIQAYNNQSTSSFTNIASINSSQIFMDKKPNKDEIKIYEFSLSQNYPNPFNPSTVISWHSPIDNLVTLKVFDILGCEVITLVDKFISAGTHSIEFDGTNLPNGIYFYRIKIGNYIETRKLILQK
ncbi:MAG: hypothetical protein A2523_17065 [Ignavibacteria bacterium RIFOXYD12_FULL_36_8]|nr:MAG: hypothetical protein A2X60_03000 [Ignavibacteria bacterium GWF2_35_20]OGV31333.1 MAG: hypothetical protein A2523_17065 [Ignavibacteria bacterium RIFOXYD12_FULL_36_8]